MSCDDANSNQHTHPSAISTFSVPDQDTVNFLFVKTKMGLLRLAQIIFTLTGWTLSLHLKDKVGQEDHSVLVLYLFATITSWMYSIFSLALSLVVMKKRSHDLIRRIMIICCSLTCAVFCLISSSLLGEWVRKLKEDDGSCKSLRNASCSQLRVSVVFGFLAMASFITDSLYEMYILKQIKEAASISNDALRHDESLRNAGRNKKV